MKLTLCEYYNNSSIPNITHYPWDFKSPIYFQGSLKDEGLAKIRKAKEKKDAFPFFAMANNYITKVKKKIIQY